MIIWSIAETAPGSGLEPDLQDHQAKSGMVRQSQQSQRRLILKTKRKNFDKRNHYYKTESCVNFFCSFVVLNAIIVEQLLEYGYSLCKTLGGCIDYQKQVCLSYLCKFLCFSVFYEWKFFSSNFSDDISPLNRPF